MALQRISYASNPFISLIPMFTNIEEAPAYLETTIKAVGTGDFYLRSEAGCPASLVALARLRVDLVVHTNADIGSPRLTGPTSDIG